MENVSRMTVTTNRLWSRERRVYMLIKGAGNITAHNDAKAWLQKVSSGWYNSHSGTINARQIDTIKRELDTIVAEGVPQGSPLKRGIIRECM